MALNIPYGNTSSDFITRFVSAMQTLSSGASGDLVTLTPPAGQRVRLTHLSAAGAEAGTTITIAGTDVLDSKDVNVSMVYTNDSYTLGVAPDGATLALASSPITGGINEELIIKKDTGSTSNTLRYMYQFGE